MAAQGRLNTLGLTQCYLAPPNNLGAPNYAKEFHQNTDSQKKKPWIFQSYAVAI